MHLIAAALSRHLGAYCDGPGHALTEQWHQAVPPLFRFRECPRPADSSHTIGRLCEHRCEPLYPHLRNLMYVEFDVNYVFTPYRVLPSLPEFRAAWHAHQQGQPGGFSTRPGRTVLVDIGVNGFFASAKHLIDLYAPHLPFDVAYLIEPDAKGMDIPDSYRRHVNLTWLTHYVEVGTGRWPYDILKWLPTAVSTEDYVVLKFDVDESTSGQTIEWGFLAELIHSEATRDLVDELFVELHFLWTPKAGLAQPQPSLGLSRSMAWSHHGHSMRQAFDVLRELRRCGIAVHAWP